MEPEATPKTQGRWRGIEPQPGWLTLGDGEVGPIIRPQYLHAFTCVQTNLAEVHCLVLILQVQDSEDSGCLRLCPVQDEPVLEMLMYETRGRIIDQFPM